MDRWGVRVIVSDQLNSDPQASKRGIIQGSNAQATVLAIHEHVAGAVIRPGGEDAVGSGRRSHDEIALAGRERVTNEPPPLRPPGVANGGAELGSNELCEPVLEAFAALIGERQVVGIGADPELT
jgi:hypothetical protein